MNREGFITYLKKQRRSQSTIENCVTFTSEFETYLQNYREVMSIENSSPEDLNAFMHWIQEEGRSANSYLWAVGRYYEYIGNKEMRKSALERRQRLITEGRGKRKKLHLREVKGIEPSQIQKLADVGIDDVTTLLESGKTKQDRERLASVSGIPLKDVLMLVKMADLTRIVDIKGIRVRLLFEAGIDTLEKLSLCEAGELQAMITEVNRKKKMMKRGPTLVETTYWITQAKELPKIIEY